MRWGPQFPLEGEEEEMRVLKSLERVSGRKEGGREMGREREFSCFSPFTGEMSKDSNGLDSFPEAHFIS